MPILRVKKPPSQMMNRSFAMKVEITLPRHHES